MKHLFLFIFLTASPYFFSQMKEGYFQYHIDVEAVDTSLKTKQAVGMLMNSKMELYFSEEDARMDFTLGKISKVSVVTNFETDSTLSLNDGAMGKIAVLGAADKATKLEDTTVRVELIDENKVLLGISCKKAILHENGVETVYWYTNELKVDPSINQMSNPKIPGFPMYFTKIDNGIRMTFQVSNLKRELDNKEEIFSRKVPPGYTLINPNNK